MLKIFIVCSDMRFLRLLELEISDYLNADVYRFGSYIEFFDHFNGEPLPEGDDAVCLLDLDTAAPDGKDHRIKRVFEKYKPYTVCFSSEEKPVFDFIPSAEFIRRPFDTEKLIMKLSKQTSPGYNVKNPSGEPGDEIRLNDSAHTAYFSGEMLELTLKEYSLLSFLMKMRGSVVSRDQIYEAVWGEKNAAGSNSVDVYIRFLRSKIDDVYDVRLIHTVRGVGYTVR